VNIDDRLRAASQALKDSSAAQVDAATPLREIVLHTGRRVPHGRAISLADQPQEPPTPSAPLLPPAPQPSRAPQRLSLAVNLLLVLALGILLVRVASYRQDAASTTPTTAASAAVVTRPEVQIKTRTKVPEVCLDAAELADDIIARLNRNQRDNRLALALRDYTIASQACRRAASP
jgi:hypothetical protein